MARVAKLLSDLRLGLLDERNGDPSFFTGIGRMVKSLLGDDDDETTIATNRRPTTATPYSPKKSLVPTVSTSSKEFFTSDRDWLEEAVAAAPLAPLSETEEDLSVEENEERKVDISETIQSIFAGGNPRNTPIIDKTDEDTTGLLVVNDITHQCRS